MIDSHCHLPGIDSLDKVASILEEAKDFGVTQLVNIGTSLAHGEDVVAVSKDFNEIHAVSAIYPHEDLKVPLNDLMSQFEEFVQKHLDTLVGIGESGIDITHWQGGRPLDDQITLFEFQADLAKKYNLPLVIHNRNGDSYILEVLRRVRPPKAVIHCFSSSWDFAQQILDLGYLVSFSGLITYSSREYLLDTVRKVPQDMFLIETDSPYLKPKGVSSEKNHPKYVKLVAEKVALERRMPLQDVDSVTTRTACSFFNLASPVL